MKKTITKTLALALAALMTLSACSNPASDANTTSPDPAATTESTTPDQPTDATTPTESESAAPATDAGEPITDMVYPILQSRELETFNILKSQRAEDSENLTNLYDGLLEADRHGALQPGIAKEWGTEDGGKTWTFTLRDNATWVDMNGSEKAAVTAWDFATGLEWVLNFHKNESNNTSMPIEMIVGAEEYYNYTKDLSADEAKALTAAEGSQFFEMVSVEVPDDYTIVYHCLAEMPYFDSVATYGCLYPMNQAMIEELGGVDSVAAMNNQNMWYNGPYTMTSYIHTNEKVFTKNPLYWDIENVPFNTVTFKMVDSNDIAFQLYQSGDVDYAKLSEANISTIYGSESNPLHDYLVPDVPSKYSYQFHFNYNKNNEDGTPDTNWNTAIANEAFRLAFYYGLDLTEFYKRINPITPMVCENNFYTMKGLVYTSDGKDYTELVREELGMAKPDGETMTRQDTEKAATYKAQAMEELSALGVTFPVVFDYYIAASNQNALDQANVLKQIWTDYLGDDFATLNIKTYVSSVRQEVVNPHLHSFVINGWGADYGDPQNYLGQETYGNDNAYYSASYSYMNEITEETDATRDLIATYKEYTELVDAANAITGDMDARYAAYAKAEAFMLAHALVVPARYEIGWAVSKVDNTTRINAMYGSQNMKMKHWKTDANAYTTQQAEANQAAKDAASN